jgi:hypothetical protein
VVFRKSVKNILLLLLQLYNSLWVLACSIISFHCFLSCTLCFQFFTPIFLRSFLASSSHLNLGLPFGLVAYGFHLYIVLATVRKTQVSLISDKNDGYFTWRSVYSLDLLFFHVRTVHLRNYQFSHQLMHNWIILKQI